MHAKLNTFSDDLPWESNYGLRRPFPKSMPLFNISMCFLCWHVCVQSLLINILPKHDKTGVISYGVCQEIIDKIIKERKYREGRTCLPRFQESLNFKSEIFESICGNNALWSLGGICLQGFQGSPKSGWWWIVRLFR